MLEQEVHVAAGEDALLRETLHVVHEEAGKIEDSGHPSDHRDHVGGLDPGIEGLKGVEHGSCRPVNPTFS